MSTGLRNRFTNLINSKGNTITIYERELEKGDYGGYEPGSDNEDSGTSSVAIASNYLTTRDGQKFGPLKEGEVMLGIRATDKIEKDYNIVYQSDPYKIEEIKEVILNNVVIYKRLKLSRRLD